MVRAHLRLPTPTGIHISESLVWCSFLQPGLLGPAPSQGAEPAVGALDIRPAQSKVQVTVGGACRPPTLTPLPREEAPQSKHSLTTRPAESVTFYTNRFPVF